MRIKKVRLPDGNVIADTGLPQRALKPQYLERHLGQMQALTDVLKDPASMKNGVVYNLVLVMFYSMLDIGRREFALDELDLRVDARIKELGADGSLDYATRIEAKSEIALACLPMFTDYLDTAYAVSHRIAIGLTGSAPDDDQMDYEIPTFADDEVMEGKWVETDE